MQRCRLRVFLGSVHSRSCTGLFCLFCLSALFFLSLFLHPPPPLGAIRADEDPRSLAEGPARLRTRGVQACAPRLCCAAACALADRRGGLVRQQA